VKLISKETIYTVMFIMNRLSLVGMQLPENIYKENFNVSSKGPSSGVTGRRYEGLSLKMLKFSLYIFR
jgi:hypothetical protein